MPRFFVARSSFALTVMLVSMSSAHADDALEATTAAWQKAFNDRDASAVVALMSEDARLLPPGSEPVTGPGNIRAFWEGVIDSGLQANIEVDDVTSSDGHGHKTGRWSLANADGQVVDHGRFVELWQRTDAGWRMHTDIWNSSMPTASAVPAEAMNLAPDQLPWTEIMGQSVQFGAVFGDWQSEAHGKLVRIEPGFSTALHQHSASNYGVVIEGELTNPISGDEHATRMGPGHFWVTPGGKTHASACVSETPCLFFSYSGSAWDIDVLEPESGD